MGDKFDLNVYKTYLQYLDANNLYGWAMSQPLPTGGFRWVNIEPNEISELATQTDKSYILEVVVSYLKELHNPFLQTDEQLSFQKNDGEYKKAQKHKTSND